MMKRLSLFAFLLTLLAGCGGATAPEHASYPSNAPASNGRSTTSYSENAAPADMPSFKSSSADAPPAPPPPPASTPAADNFTGGRSASAEPSPTPAPCERQGLGTEWGETRVSRVHDVSFVRADPSRPFAVAQIFYNDRPGVDALANLHHASTRVREVEAGDGSVSVSIRDGSGDPLEALRVGERSYVVGQAGQRYTIVLQNHSSHTFEAVASVDGLDVINGKTGTLDNRGYIVAPYATLEIDGFRQSQDAVAAFRFGSVGDSYAAQTGSARNVGVIGVAIFAERGDQFLSERDLRLRDTANPFPGSDPRFAQPPRR